MLNLERLKLELNNKEYFGYDSERIYTDILSENNLDSCDDYEKSNDRVNMLESVYAILQMLANDIENFQNGVCDYLCCLSVFTKAIGRCEK